MDSSRIKKVLVKLLAIALISLTQDSIVIQSDAAARLIRVPLTRSTTQGAGLYKQPVVNYYAELQVGTPPKNFNVQFDLDSSDHFLPHISRNPFNRNLHYRDGFQCKLSSTCKKKDQVTSFTYQNCKLTGKNYDDVISIHSVGSNMQPYAHNASEALQPIRWRQNFNAVSSAGDGRFSSLPIDGYFGLAPTIRSSTGLDNILNRLHEQGHIDNLQISMWFNPLLDSPHGGELILGGVDPFRYQGNIYWHSLPAVNGNYWMLDLQSITLGSRFVGCTNSTSTKCRVRFSSGLSDIYGPPNDVKQIYSLLNVSQSNGLQLIDCRRINGLPNITFNIEGTPYLLYPSNYVRKTVGGYIFKEETCYVAILPSDETNEWILGTNFLGAYYSIYDMTYRQIGFASLR